MSYSGTYPKLTNFPTKIQSNETTNKIDIVKL